MSKWSEKYRAWAYKTMQGRYGPDSFGTFLFILALILDLIGAFARPAALVLYLIAWACLIFEIYRFYSKNIVKRSLENQKYRDATAVFRRGFKAAKSNSKDKTYKYFLCPKCHQTIRVPRGHGKVTITCPKCGETFTRRS